MIGEKLIKARMTVAAPGGTLGAPSKSGRARIYRKGERAVSTPTGREVEVVNDFRGPVPAGARVNLAVVRGAFYMCGVVAE